MYLSGRQGVGEAPSASGASSSGACALLQRSGRHQFSDEDDRFARGLELNKGKEGEDVLVRQALEELNFGPDLSLLRLADTVHDDLAPSHLNPFLLVKALVDVFERSLAQLMVVLPGAGVP